jgi:hypothetical protein
MVGAAVVVAQLSFRAPIVAQQKPAAEETSNESPERAPVRGRLPAYFSAIVTSQQREKIYLIQQRYDQQLDELRMQVEQLISERDRELDAVLTAEQLAIVQQKRADAQKRREMRRAAQQPSSP